MGFKDILIQYDLLAYLLLGIGVVAFVIYKIIRIVYPSPKKVIKYPKIDDDIATILADLERPKIIKKNVRAEKVMKKKLTIVKKEPEILVDAKIKPFSILKGKSKLSYPYWREWYINKYRVSSAVLINMELLNGFHRIFTVLEKEEGFVFKGKKYLFDDESKYYNIDAKLYAFDYHEGLVLPVKRKIPVTSIKKTLESTEGIDVEYAINPSTLQRFMTAKIAEGVMKGTQLDEFFRKINMFIIVIMVAVLVHLALFIYASGILQNVQLPF